MPEESDQNNGPANPEILEELKRIKSSPAFVQSEQMVRFIGFLVQKTLAGKAHELRERLIAHVVFDRPKDFNPLDDNIVRTEKRRLKKKLSEYYASAMGKESRVRISLMRHYKPTFEYSSSTAPVSRPGAFKEWQHADLKNLLQRIERDDSQSEDLRIVTSGFSGSILELQLLKLIKTNLRIRILLLNPENPLLMSARNDKRHDTSIEGASAILKGQIKELEFLQSSVRNLKGCSGSLEFRLSNAMPFSFVAHTRKWALAASFLCRQTYSEGPLLEMDANTQLWKTLHQDWQERWEDANPKLPQALPNLVYKPQIPEGFNEFFGEGASERIHEGAIVLQSDNIKTLLKGLVPYGERKINASPKSRVYKARTWINRWDTEGAMAIQQELQQYGLGTPSLIHSEHDSHLPIATLSPFQIAMGLGFTDRTTSTIKVCEQWLRVTREPDSGDALSLHNQVEPKERLTRFSKTAKSEVKGFFRLLPLDFDKKYLNNWLRAADGKPVTEVQDYAIILRHTQRDDPRQILFVLAGFTERGTAIAGRYFAKNWPKLWEKYVAGKVDTPSRGDFFTVIGGPSLPDSVDAWREDPNFEAITPEKLSGPIAWSKRF